MKDFLIEVAVKTANINEDIQTNINNGKSYVVAFCGGGSGGHVTPNIALIEYLHKIRPDVIMHYIGTDGLEKNLLKSYPYVIFHTITANKLVRDKKNLIKNLALPFSVAKSISQSKKILRTIQPNVVFSKGGYVSLPVVMASKKLKIPAVSHESDLTMGLSNKLISRNCDVMLSTFPITGSVAVAVGSPINQRIYQGNREKAWAMTGFDDNKKILLVTGGSLGAVALNNFVKNNINELKKKYQVVLISGKNKQIDLPNGNGFFQIPYTTNIADLYAITDLCITRGGSNTLCELIALNIPFVCVPLAHSTRGEQMQNANYLAKLGWGKIVSDTQLNIETLDECLTHKGNTFPLDGTGVIAKYIMAYENT